MPTFKLIGAGGHAKAVVEGIVEAGGSIEAYIDPKSAEWLSQVRHIRSETFEIGDADQFVLGVGGLTIAQLQRRLSLLAGYLELGASFPPIVHPTAHVSKSAILGPGVIVLAAAVIQPDVRISRGTIVNTAAIVEHDTFIDEGAHVAPGAVVLGGCRVGSCSIVGTRSIVLPGAVVPAQVIVRAGGVFKNPELDGAEI